MKSIRGVGTALKVILYVTKTEWSGSCHALDSLAAMSEAEEPGLADGEGWTVVEKPAGCRGFKNRS